jgi:acetylornithine deacetylase/succinyl-diaminopimelate desuccinylase-like protein
MDADSKVQSYLDDHAGVLSERLSEWIRIPSVAGVPERKHNLVRSANWLAGELRDVGFPTTEIWQGAEGPAVFAEWAAAPGSPTLLIYSHHDVRAVKEENWDQTSPSNRSCGTAGFTAAEARMPKVR